MILASAAAFAAKRDALFYAIFAAFAVAALSLGLSSAFGPGQDYPYHVMSAALTARVWSGDAFFAGLYAPVNPLDSNTLLYTVLFPLEMLLSPLDAMRVGFSVLYFLGYPVSCVVALRMSRRPLWGALLAFPLAYVKSWSGGGYLPFVASAPLMILTFALLQRIIDPSRIVGTGAAGVPSRRSMVTAAVVAALLFFAHGHVFAWTLSVFALVTLLVIARALLVDGLRDPTAALRSALRIAARMTAVVAVPAALALWWYVRKQSGAQAAVGPQSSVVANEPWQQRVGGALGFLLHTTDDREFLHAAALVVLCLAILLFARRASEERVPSFEIAFVLGLITFLLLPNSYAGQGLSSRQFDLAVWVLPCILYPRPLRGAPLRHAAIVSAIVVFGVVRLRTIATHLRGVQEELAGLLEIAKDCPPGPPQEIAYASMTMSSRYWLAPTFHHAVESLAASCRLDSPAYDPRIYPYNMAPIRYRTAPPAPPKFLYQDPIWYRHGGLWDDYEYVLVHAWQPTREQLAEANAVAERIRNAGREGEWQLWKRRPPKPL